jgi:hypothetical protein
MICTLSRSVSVTMRFSRPRVRSNLPISDINPRDTETYPDVKSGCDRWNTYILSPPRAVLDAHMSNEGFICNRWLSINSRIGAALFQPEHPTRALTPALCSPCEAVRRYSATQPCETFLEWSNRVRTVAPGRLTTNPVWWVIDAPASLTGF